MCEVQEVAFGPRDSHVCAARVETLRSRFCFHGYASFVYRLCRTISDRWMRRSGRSWLTSPVDELVLLHSPPPLKHLSIPPPLHGARHPLLAPWRCLLLCLASPPQLDPPDPNQAAPPVCRYPPPQADSGLVLQVFPMLISLVCGPGSPEQERGGGEAVARRGLYTRVEDRSID